MILVPPVFLSENLFEPICLTVSERLIRETWRMTDDEIFQAYVAPQDLHCLKITGRLVPQLVLLYRY